jgi:hypothetical protein
MNLDRYGSPVPRGGAQGAAAATVEPDTLSGCFLFLLLEC